ncbi:MAG: hypothetical protein IPG07_16955 [Crocinitomicaceae bacterium]|nr:hypothetical protein [Crocinitomicaceae bacterium]
MVANRRRIKVVLAPRGMLGQGALEIKKGRKKFFLTLARFSGFYRRVKWHASTSEEEIEIKEFLEKGLKFFIAQNIPITQSKTLDEILNQKTLAHVVFIFSAALPVKKSEPWQSLLLNNSMLKCLCFLIFMETLKTRNIGILLKTR